MRSTARPGVMFWDFKWVTSSSSSVRIVSDITFPFIRFDTVLGFDTVGDGVGVDVHILLLDIIV